MALTVSHPPIIPVASTTATAQPQTPTTPDAAAPRGAHGRPAGDNRSAEQIFKDMPILKDILKQDGPFASNFLNKLKDQTGDWSAANRNPESRANAAYNLAEVAKYIDGREALTRQAPTQQNDQHVQGFGSFGSVSAGSEAQLLKAFSEQGYSAL
ncbi:hypothetical protein [Pseudomonas sp. MPB23]|uniref:hypothetical protein n=1 Tax=Pseudomonas sp. MPB23 TaxID=3388490 RepID=UPI003984F389